MHSTFGRQFTTERPLVDTVGYKHRISGVDPRAPVPVFISASSLDTVTKTLTIFSVD